jgi:hypothetical protein
MQSLPAAVEERSKYEVRSRSQRHLEESRIPAGFIKPHALFNGSSYRNPRTGHLAGACIVL